VHFAAADLRSWLHRHLPVAMRCSCQGLSRHAEERCIGDFKANGANVHGKNCPGCARNAAAIDQVQLTQLSMSEKEF